MLIFDAGTCTPHLFRSSRAPAPEERSAESACARVPGDCRFLIGIYFNERISRSANAKMSFASFVVGKLRREETRAEFGDLKKTETRWERILFQYYFTRSNLAKLKCDAYDE